jgi:translation initiation factor 2 gamma subunit (eIF-2gamma)
MQQRLLLGGAPAGALVAVLLAVHSPSPAADMLRGGDMAGTVEPGDYRVAQTITVREGATLTIKAGTRIRFAPFTGIVVNGLPRKRKAPVPTNPPHLIGTASRSHRRHPTSV